jgi:hypothetical protein
LITIVKIALLNPAWQPRHQAASPEGPILTRSAVFVEFFRTSSFFSKTRTLLNPAPAKKQARIFTGSTAADLRSLRIKQAEQLAHLLLQRFGLLAESRPEILVRFEVESQPAVPGSATMP